MIPKNSIEQIAKRIPIKTNKFSGDTNENGQRHGVGKDEWGSQQIYEGRYVNDSLHGRGEYSEYVHEEPTTYEGMFYANNIEGYGRISYLDCSIFEGLFKCNGRFGPGVLTYQNNTQDVGLWYGRSLIRLCKIIKPQCLPSIANTHFGKVALLKFKTLVRVCKNEAKLTKNILKNMDVDEEVIKNYKKFYNNEIRHPKSLFFNTPLYERHFFCKKDCYIEVPILANQKVASSSAKDLSSNESSSSETECESFFQFRISNNYATDGLSEFRIQKFENELNNVNCILFEIEDKIHNLYCKLKQFKLKHPILHYSEEIEEEPGEETEKLQTSEVTIENYLESLECEIAFEEEDEEMNYEEMYNCLDILLNERQNYSIKKECLIHKINFEKFFRKENANKRNKLVLVTDLLAFNNQGIFIELLKHSFLHRKFEKDMSFSATDILCGNRTKFLNCGIYESDCISFLSECSSGHGSKVTELHLKHDINPDICDARGNTGIMFAAARDKIDVIYDLVNFGANVDAYNDECLTPLSLCMLRYLAVLNYVTNWETAFLKPTLIDVQEELETLHWRPNASLVSVASLMSCNSKAQDESQTETPSNVSHEQAQQDLKTQKYLLNANCIRPKHKSKKSKGKSKGTNTTLSSKKSRKSKKKKSSKKSKKSTKSIKAKAKLQEISEKEAARNKKLAVIHNTISNLLKHGSNPDIGEVPMPALILAVFTNNLPLIEDILVANANPNISTLDEKMTALHIVAALPPTEDMVKIMKVLLRYSADCNYKTNSCHWNEQKKILLGDYVLTGEDVGKSPLHILCMRYDFILDKENYLCDMAKMLIKNGASVNDFYLGHTPLTLAIVRGNRNLIKLLLKTGKIDPNGLLGEDLGVPLTVLILKRYHNLIRIETCKEIIKLLIEFKANPFNTTGDRGNSIEFMNTEFSKAGGKMTEKTKNERSNKKSEKGKSGKVFKHKIKACLTNVAKYVLRRHLKGRITKYLYFFVEKENFYDDSIEQMARHLSVQDVIHMVQLLIHRGQIPITENTYNTLYDLIEFIININSNLSDIDEPASSFVNINHIVRNIELKRKRKLKGLFNLLEPEVEEHSEKYDVCFHCYKRKDVELYVCPKCNVVYFCSQICNMLNNEQDDPTHKCNIIFYNTEKKTHQELFLKGYAKMKQDLNKYLNSPLNIQPNPAYRLGLTRKIDFNQILASMLASNNKAEPVLNTPQNLNRQIDLKNSENETIGFGKMFRGKKVSRRKNINAIKDKLKTKFVNLLNQRKPAIPISSSGDICHFQRRLPVKYQRFLETIARYWPDFDLARIFLPYACYSDGQLYYKFFYDEPMFMETYSKN